MMQYCVDASTALLPTIFLFDKVLSDAITMTDIKTLEHIMVDTKQR